MVRFDLFRSAGDFAGRGLRIRVQIGFLVSSERRADQEYRFLGRRSRERVRESLSARDQKILSFQNPFMLSSSVVSSSYDMLKRAFEAGWAGASFKTICNFPQHEASPRFSSLNHHSHAFCGFKNIEQLSDHSVEENMQIFEKLRKEFPSKVIIASIMGQNESEWTELAAKCEAAGASVIECNFSCPNMENETLGITIGQSEELIERFTRATKKGTSLPVLYPVFNYGRCNGCGRCYISYMDGGHQAIVFDPALRRPVLKAQNCVGCHLCRLVCSEMAIDIAGKKVERR